MLLYLYSQTALNSTELNTGSGRLAKFVDSTHARRASIPRELECACQSGAMSRRYWLGRMVRKCAEERGGLVVAMASEEVERTNNLALYATKKITLAKRHPSTWHQIPPPRNIPDNNSQFTMAERGRKQIDQAYHSSSTRTHTKLGADNCPLIALHQFAFL